MKIYSWNVNGLRAIIKKGAFQKFVDEYQPDILCLQETKAKQGQAEIDLPEYEEIWDSAERAGYSGTAIFVRTGLGVSDSSEGAGGSSDGGLRVLSSRFGFSDAAIASVGEEAWADDFGDARTEGRVLTAEFEDFYLITAYVPNAKDDLGRLKYREKVWDPALLAYIAELEKTKPVVICGDFNVAHEEIDLARPKQNVGHAGFTHEERQGMTNYLAHGLVDTYRALHPEDVQYTWWSYRGGARARNVGWRIDYFLVSSGLRSRVTSAEICDEVMGSDHCPVMIEIK